MKRQHAAIIAIIIIIVFIAFIIYDSATERSVVPQKPDAEIVDAKYLPNWEITGTIPFEGGKLKAVALTQNGIIAGGASFVSFLNKDLTENWSIQTSKPVTGIYASDDTIFATTEETILLLDYNGITISEWGPYEENSIITSISGNSRYIAIADAGEKMIHILDKTGEIKYFIGQNDPEFIIPSPYFDVNISEDDIITVANPGQRRVETRDIEGNVLSMFGEAGAAPEAFCGCCNPSHFSFFDENTIVTSEKGINRIKLLDRNGNFLEFVSVQDQFISTLPFDLAVDPEGVIYAANTADSKLYIFKRKND